MQRVGNSVRVRVAAHSVVCLLALALMQCTSLDEGKSITDGGALRTDAETAGGPSPTSGGAGGTSGGSSGSSGDSGGGRTDGGAGTGVTSGCSPESALRCTSAGSTAREQCQQGAWVMAEPCEEGELCDSSNTQMLGACASAAVFCQGSADQKVCVSGVMHQCNADAISISQDECQSQRHCQVGLPMGSCAACIPGETFRCEEARLEVCNAEGTGFELSETCDTAALCNAGAKACTAQACLADTFSCSAGDELSACNDDNTAFEAVMPCSAGLCDAVNGQCDVCATGETTCMGGSPASCNAQGQGYDTSSCASDRPICTGQGVCVACTGNADCTAAPPRCRQQLCNVGSGDCTTAITPGATCTPDAGGSGVCTALGECVGCQSDDDCESPSAPRCNTTTRRCVPCVEADDCSTTMQCRAAYCDTSNNQCAVAIDEGASCGALDICNASGNCVDCISDSECTVGSSRRCDTSSYECVQCTSNGHCTTPGLTRCFTGDNTCVQCTSDAQCTTAGQTRCDTGSHTCVQCTTASQCGSTVDFACTDSTCVRIPRCGNGILEPQNNEQCDDPAHIGQNSCSNTCRIAGYYGPCSLSNGTLCPDPFDDSQCGALVSDTARMCLPGCSTSSQCPNLVGWPEVCMFTSCMLDCSASGTCPLGYTCTRADFGGSGSFDVCVLPD